MIKRIAALLLLLCMLPLSASAEDGAEYRFTKRSLSAEYVSDTLRYEIWNCSVNGIPCYVTTVWMADPARQIRKAISPWKEKLYKAETLAGKIEDAALVINGSGYVSPTYPTIPDSYPGTSEDYYYTPLGSLTVVDGEIYRNLEGVPYYGLTLEADGLHMYVGEDNETVLSHHPIQTWSFFDGCPMSLNGVDLLDHEWYFVARRFKRTIIAKLQEENTYVIVTVTDEKGMSLIDANNFLNGEFHPEWIYDLDGGPSSTLMRRLYGKKTLKTLLGAGQRIVDIMAFVE